ncbi:hypothetical protein [Enterovibrio norvegicus]|uniref:hypothetical protein n=1 Tax=Enterovibrio norvegicus TaxID=188144 RepID=UPI000C82CEA7|nr:hypothetical protein [Enterovibrio norvegicus]PMN69679.1 hypothetical protein BCT27_20310 [Enterovibrio norvegicus]
MRYYLITTHQRPKFYRANGSVVDAELSYVDKKEIRTLNANGELSIQTIEGCRGNDLLSDKSGTWIIRNMDDAIATLEKAAVYPFESKEAARQHAKQLEITSFKYLPVP